MIINDGVRKDSDGRYRFDKQIDLDTDIIELTKDISGIKQSHNLTYIYAYAFKDKVKSNKKREFRNALKYNIENTKYFYSEELFDFVEDGVFRLDEYKNLDTFNVLVSVKPTYEGKHTLLDLLTLHINEYSSTGIISFELLKEIIKNVTFDAEKAFKALKSTKKYGNRSDQELWNIVRDTEDTFNEANPEDKFVMKKYLPVVIREGFIDYLKFQNEHEKEIYRHLAKGTEVLIIDDFITSGSTLKEIIRYLNTINPNNNITAFAFIDQLRDY